MLDLKFIREHSDAVRQMLQHRRSDAVGDLDRLLELDRQWRENLTHTQSLKAHQNKVSQQIAERKRANQDATETIAEMRALSQQIKEFTAAANDTKATIDAILLTIPNMPEGSTPLGTTEADNLEIKTWGELPSFDFEPKLHWELAETARPRRFPAWCKGGREQLRRLQRAWRAVGTGTYPIHVGFAHHAARLHRNLAAVSRESSDDDRDRTAAEV